MKIAVSGKGGVGKSTVSANLACALVHLGAKVGLLDCDIYGPSIPLMMGLKQRPTISAEEKLVPPANYNVKLMSMGFLVDGDQPVIWRGPMLHGSINQFLGETEWGELDYLIIDSPPGTGDEPLSVAQTIADARAVIVTTPQEVSLADVRKSINFCKIVKMNIFGLIENMSGFICPHCDKPVDIFGTGGGKKTALEFNLTFLGNVPMDPKVVAGGDTGRPYLSSGAGSIATKAFEQVIDNVLKELPVQKEM